MTEPQMKNSEREENVSRWFENLLKHGDRYLLHGIAVVDFESDILVTCRCRRVVVG